jgi:hypothetical protein
MNNLCEYYYLNDIFGRLMNTNNVYMRLVCYQSSFDPLFSKDYLFYSLML